MPFLPLLKRPLEDIARPNPGTRMQMATRKTSPWIALNWLNFTTSRCPHTWRIPFVRSNSSPATAELDLWFWFWNTSGLTLVCLADSYYIDQGFPKLRKLEPHNSLTFQLVDAHWQDLITYACFFKALIVPSPIMFVSNLLPLPSSRHQITNFRFTEISVKCLELYAVLVKYEFNYTQIFRTLFQSLYCKHAGNSKFVLFLSNHSMISL